MNKGRKIAKTYHKVLQNGLPMDKPNRHKDGIAWLRVGVNASHEFYLGWDKIGNLYQAALDCMDPCEICKNATEINIEIPADDDSDSLVLGILESCGNHKCPKLKKEANWTQSGPITEPGYIGHL